MQLPSADMKRFLLLSFGAFLAAHSPGLFAGPETNSHDPSWVKARVAEIEVKPSERHLDEIGWAKDIREAERLAQQSGRPVFLFTHDGRLNIGRC